MMHVLALDTCFGAVSAAVATVGEAREAHVLAGTFERCATGHAERLMPMVEAVMREAGLTFRDLGLIAVTHGPGTFTGLRTTVAAARAFALATGTPIAAAPTLGLMALQASLMLAVPLGTTPITVALDARRGQIWLATLAVESDWLATDARLVTVAEAAEHVRAVGGIVVGSGASLIVAPEAAIGGLSTALPDLEPDARILAAHALRLTPTDRLVPFYLREPDAKPQVQRAVTTTP